MTSSVYRTIFASQNVHEVSSFETAGLNYGRGILAYLRPNNRIIFVEEGDAAYTQIKRLLIASGRDPEKLRNINDVVDANCTEATMARNFLLSQVTDYTPSTPNSPAIVQLLDRTVKITFADPSDSLGRVILD